MEKILISIVIPTYKRPQLLSKCLLAITSQTLPDSSYEVIVVSDGPDDQSAKVAREIFGVETNHRFVSLPEKQGPAAARNLGWKKASGALIAFTDDDCLPDKNWLVSLLEAFGGETLVAFSGRIEVPVQNPLTDFARNTANLEHADFVTANCCVTKAALELTGGFDERFRMAWREDSELEFKLLSAGISVKRVESAVVIHPVRDAAWGVSIREQHKGMFNALLYKKFPELYRSKIQSSPQWNYYLIVISSILLVIGIILHQTFFILPSLVLILILMTVFIVKRLKNTSHKPGHVLEMILTSLAIPYLSVYWQLYGSFKYRVLFL